MHRLKYFALVTSIVLICGFILWKQGNKMWSQVATQVVSEKIKFITDQNLTHSSMMVKGLKKQLNKIVTDESTVRQLGQMHLGLTPSFRSSDIVGVIILKEIKKKHQLDWMVLKSDTLKLWSKSFIEQTWQKHLASFQKNKSETLQLLKHPSGHKYWGFVTNSNPLLKDSKGLVIAVLPLNYFQSRQIASKNPDKLSSVLVNSNWDIISHSQKAYVSNNMKQHGVAQGLNLAATTTAVTVPFKLGSDSQLGFLQPIAGTNLFYVTFSPLATDDGFVRSLLSSTLIAMLYVLLAAILILLLLPERLKDKHNELLIAVRQLAFGQWELSERQAKLIPEAVESLQKIDNRLQVLSKGVNDREMVNEIRPMVNGNEQLNTNIEKKALTDEAIELEPELAPNGSALGGLVPEQESGRSPDGTGEQHTMTGTENLPESTESAIVDAKDDLTHPLRVTVQNVLTECSEFAPQCKVQFQLNDLKLFRMEEAESENIKKAIKPVIKNAFEACMDMDDGAVITISGGVTGNYYKMTVADTGGGLTGEVVNQAFDPFFTTKSSSANPGLGLTAAKNQMQKLNGFIAFRPPTGEGTVVDITWPVNETTARRSERDDSSILSLPSEEQVKESTNTDSAIGELSDLDSSPVYIQQNAEEGTVHKFVFAEVDNEDEFSSSEIGELSHSLVDDISHEELMQAAQIDDEEDLPDMLIATTMSGGTSSGISLSESSKDFEEFVEENKLLAEKVPDALADDPRNSLSDLDDFKVTIRSPKINE